MIQNFDQLENNQVFTADVCIIGGGAAGITLAREFFNTPHRVILLEGGGKKYEQQSQALYQSTVAGLSHHGIHEGRARVYGGTTTLWAGQALPLDEIDFEDRDWVQHSGWPLRRSELEQFYRRAEKVMNLPAMTYDESAWPASALKPPKYDPEKLRASISQFSPTPDFGRTYHAALAGSPNVDVLVHANATNIRTNARASAVEQVEIGSLSGKRATVHAKIYIICCGGIETARLMLASNSIEPNGLGNGQDLVGRYFQDHIHCKAAVIQPTDRSTLQRMYDQFYAGEIKYYPKIQSSERLQRYHRILNVVGDVCYDVCEDAPVESAKILLRSLRRADLRPKISRAAWNVARRPHELAAAAYKYFIRGQTISESRGTIYLGVQCESQPNPNSRVTLGEERDALGMRRTVLNWQLTELDRRTIDVFVRTVAEEFERLKIGRIDLSQFSLPEDLAQMDRKVSDASHHMGTTRMHDSPAQGVVDRECKVHGMDNLYIGSSSVFPTSGYSNPTLTVIALCMRMADRLKQRLAASPLPEAVVA